MTNAKIILMEQLELLKQGIIGTTGRTFEVEQPDGSIKTLEEPEPIHTYAAWKALGYQVKKGEHAIAKFAIWKAGKGKAASDEDGKADGEKPQGVKMFMKVSHFFKPSQVEAIEK